METWDEMAYGPLAIDVTAARLVRFGEISLILGRTEFMVLLRLMACQGGAVSRAMLEYGLVSNCALRLTIYRLRKHLIKHLGGLIIIKPLWQFGYKLSLSGKVMPRSA